MTETKWTNGDWTVEQFDIDTILITGPYTQKCVIHGGDFESILAALAAAYERGQADPEDKS